VFFDIVVSSKVRFTAVPRGEWKYPGLADSCLGGRKIFFSPFWGRNRRLGRSGWL